MHPCAFESGPFVGQHVHISLNKSEKADHFLAGLLRQFRALTAFLNGGFDSYSGRSNLNGAGDIVWGRGKYVPVRRVTDAHFEIRTPDCLSNPYLQIAAIISAGISGVIQQIPLSIKSSEWNEKMEPMPAALKKQLGISGRLPRDLGEALEVLSGDDGEVLRLGLGSECLDAYLAYKVEEIKQAGMVTAEERRRATIKNV